MAKQNKNIFPFGWKHAIAVIAFGLCVGAIVGDDSRYLKEQKIAKQKKEILKHNKKSKEKNKTIDHPVHNVLYRVDTLSSASRGLLYHSMGKIIRIFVPNSDKYRMQLMNFVHEQWHLHNYQIRYRTKLLFKPEEYFRLCMHEEISANIAQLLTTRYEYMAATDKKKIIDAYRNGVFGFYFKALQDGKINPFDNSPEARQKEWTLIANGTYKMWLDKFYSYYKSNSYSYFQSYLKQFGFVDDSKKNYNYVRNYMYTIGGVNFAEYMSEDVPVYSENVDLAQKLSEIVSLRKYKKPIFDQVSSQIHLLDSVAIDKRSECFQHILIAEQLKFKLQNFHSEYLENNPQLIQKHYNHIMHDVCHDQSFKKVVSEYDYFTIPQRDKYVSNATYESILQQIYSLDGMDLRTKINGYDDKNVPFKPAEKFQLIAKNDLMKKYMFAIFPTAEVEEVRDAFTLKQNEVSVSSTLNNRSGLHLSEEMALEVPNFWEPILLDRSPEVWEKICKSIRKFEKIPDVEKKCNIEAQKAYHLQTSQKER